MITKIYFTYISSILALFWVLLTPSMAPAQGVRWEGPELAASGWVDAHPDYLGWIWSGPDGTSDWVYLSRTGRFAYMPADYVRDAGGWAYLDSFAEMDLEAVDSAAAGWYLSHQTGTWVYADEAVASNNSGWVYLVNTGTGLPLAPEEIILEASHAADHDAATVEDRFANSIRLTSDYVAQFADFALPVVAEYGPEGVTFTNLLNTPGGGSNRYVRIGLWDSAGYFDFTALEGVSGRIGMVVHADVDLTGTSNGFYVRAKSNDVEVAAYERLPGGVLEEDILLEPYLTNHEDNTYLEITLPWQGRITIKDIYLYMDSQARGFSDMEAKITGGEGATPENTHTVSNAAELVSALRAVRDAAGTPSIIYVDGLISYNDWVAAGQNGREAAISGSMSNVSIIGVSDQGIMDGVGFAVQTNNVIIQNLTIRYVLGRDAIQVNNGTYVWIDHCTLHNEPFNINPDKDKFDELISAKNDARHIIVSWNKIHDSHKTVLVGSNDEVDALPDRRMIFHHNWFFNGGSRHPLYRGGYAHIYNNYFQNIDSGINTRTNSKIRIENNYFENVGGAIGYWFDGANPSGLWDVGGNIFENVNGNKPTTSTIDIQFAGDYTYTLDATADVPSIVTAGAGVGKL